MAQKTDLQTAANKINEILDRETRFVYFVSPGKRALTWFKRYDIELLTKGKNGAGYSISRTDARWALFGLGLDLDEMLHSVGLK